MKGATGNRKQGTGERERRMSLSSWNFSRRLLLLLFLFSISIVVWPRIALCAEERTNRFKGFPMPEDHPVKVMLISGKSSIQPGGRTRVGVLFHMEEGWHIYGKDPGDAGLPTQLSWVVPGSVTMGEIKWPKAQEFLDPGNIRTFGYAEEVVLASDLMLASDVRRGETIVVRADVKWLACKNICLPGSTSAELTLPVREESPEPSSSSHLFESFGFSETTPDSDTEQEADP